MVAGFVFRNSLVFHDVDNMTSVFIHLSPALLFWRIRWGAGMGPGVVNAHWHLFDVCDDYAAADACVQSPDGEPNFALAGSGATRARRSPPNSSCTQPSSTFSAGRSRTS